MDTLTPGGTIETDDLFIVTINGKSISVAAGGTTAATVVDSLIAALQASTEPEFTEITWADAGNTLTATAVTAGKPHTITVSTTEAGGGAADAQTFTKTATTASAGPHDVSIAANWSGATLPVDGDTVWFDGKSDALYNLGSLSAANPANVYIPASYTGKIGLPEYNGLYYEYRATYLVFGAGTGAIVITIGDGPGTGSGRIKIDTGAAATTLNVHHTGSPADGQGAHSVYFKGTSASNAVEVTKGVVGIAALPGETANLSGGLAVGFVSSRDGDAVVYLGTGVTNGTITQSGGTLTVQSAATALTKSGGTTYHTAGTITTLTNDVGTVYCQVGGTAYTTINLGNKGVLDCSRDTTARTWTTCNMYAGATLYDPATTTGNSPFTTVRCTLADVTVNKGPGKTYTPS